MTIPIRIYDDGGKSLDRYTLVVPSVDEPGKLDMWGFNGNPYHPQGFGQYAGSYPRTGSYSHLGKLISLDDLPEQAQRYVRDTVTTPLPDGYGMPLPTSWGKRKRVKGRVSRAPRRRSPTSLGGVR